MGGANGLAAMEGSMNEAELDRLRRAVKRLMNGENEALAAVEQALEESEGIEQEMTLGRRAGHTAGCLVHDQATFSATDRCS